MPRIEIFGELEYIDRSEENIGGLVVMVCMQSF